MEIAELEEALRLVDSCISRLKWRLRASLKRRLETDILGLCTGLRPVVMVDYGGKMPELQERLCSVLLLVHQESSFLRHLRVMVIEDMIYLVHVRGLAEHVQSSLSLQHQLLFVDLDQDPPKMLLQKEENLVVSQLVSIQKFFSLVFPVGENSKVEPPLPTVPNIESSEQTTVDLSSITEFSASQCPELIDLSSCMQDTQVTPPTLNGWLLGYPVVYLFSKEHAADAISTLSTRGLHLFNILVSRNQLSKEGTFQELMSFTVPYELSIGGKNEPWAEAFVAHMQAKLERCGQIWRHFRLEVSECYPHSIVL